MPSRVQNYKSKMQLKDQKIEEFDSSSIMLDRSNSVFNNLQPFDHNSIDRKKILDTSLTGFGCSRIGVHILTQCFLVFYAKYKALIAQLQPRFWRAQAMCYHWADQELKT